MKITITILFSLFTLISYSQIISEVSSASVQNENLEFSVGSIYMSGQIESGLIAQSLSDSTIVNVEDIAKTKYLLYPNPASQELTIRYQELPKEIKIYNYLGQLVTKLPHLNGKVKVDQLPTGLYFIKLNERISIPFIKE